MFPNFIIIENEKFRKSFHIRAPNYSRWSLWMVTQKERKTGRYARKIWAFCYRTEVNAELFAILTTLITFCTWIIIFWWMFLGLVIQILIGSISLLPVLAIAENLYTFVCLRFASYQTDARFQLHRIPFTRYEIFWWNFCSFCCCCFFVVSKGIQNHWRWWCSWGWVVVAFVFVRFLFNAIELLFIRFIFHWHPTNFMEMIDFNIIWMYDMVRDMRYAVFYWICNIRLAFHWFHCLCSVSVQCYQHIGRHIDGFFLHLFPFLTSISLYDMNIRNLRFSTTLFNKCIHNFHKSSGS